MRFRSKKPPCICCYGDGPEADGYQLFTHGAPHPSGWVHRQCMIDYVTRNAVQTSSGLVLAKACIVCEVNVRVAELASLHADPAADIACAWVHLECVADYE